MAKMSLCKEDMSVNKTFLPQQAYLEQRGGEGNNNNKPHKWRACSTRTENTNQVREIRTFQSRDGDKLLLPMWWPRPSF